MVTGLVVDSVPGIVLALAFLGASPGNVDAGLSAVALATSLDDAAMTQQLQQIGLAALERGAKGKGAPKSAATPIRSLLRDRPIRGRVFPFLRR